jgi:hypothetical protein
MPVRIPATTVSKIASLANSTNAALISEFYQYMKKNGGMHQKVILKVILILIV